MHFRILKMTETDGFLTALERSPQALDRFKGTLLLRGGERRGVKGYGEKGERKGDQGRKGREGGWKESAKHPLRQFLPMPQNVGRQVGPK